MEQKNKDIFFRLKYMGFCLAALPPKDANPSYEDYIEHAKFVLCRETNRLMKDPIWKKYRDEEILREFFALEFFKNNDYKEEFEANLIKDSANIYDAFSEWSNQQINKAEQERNDAVKKMESELEDVNFIPGDE